MAQLVAQVRELGDAQRYTNAQLAILAKTIQGMSGEAP